MPSGGLFGAQEVKRKSIVCTIYTWKRENNIMPGQTKWSRRSTGTRDQCCGQCLSDASGKNFVLEFAIEKLDVQASHLQGSNVRCVLPNGCHQVKQRNLPISNIQINISLTTFWNHGLPIVDQSVCAMHEVLYAMAGSNQCQLADPQHVEAISGNARQVFEDQLYKFCGAQLQNKPPM